MILSKLFRDEAQHVAQVARYAHWDRVPRPLSLTLDAPGRIIGVHMDVTLSSSHFQVLWPATKPPASPTYSRPIKSSAVSRLVAPLRNPCGTNPLPAQAAKAGVAPKLNGLIQNPCGQNPVALVSAFQHRVATTTVPDGPVLTTGSNRSLRSLGRAKARPLTKR